MWRILGWIKSVFGGKGTLQIGKENNAVSASSTGGNSPVITAGRDVHLNMNGTQPPLTEVGDSLIAKSTSKTRKEELIAWIREHGSERPLSQVLQRSLELAQIIGDQELEHWVRLELIGYSKEGGMMEHERVPDYRDVSGCHVRPNGQMMRISDPRLSMVNTYRFRKGVGTLEEMSKNTEMITIRDEDIVELMRKHLKTDVIAFCFSPMEITQVLNTIRTCLLDKVNHSLRSAQQVAT